MGRFAKSAAEAALRLAAVVSVAMAALWVLGYNGTGVVSSGLPGGAERLVTSPELTSWGALPSTNAVLRDRADIDQLYDVTRQLGAMDAGVEPEGYAEVMLGPHVQLFAPSAGERWLYVAVHVATWLGIAVLWWLLAGVARSAGRESPFTVENAHRLTVAGALLMVGSVVSSIATYLVLGRLLASSTVVERVDHVGYDLFLLPWGSIAAGAALLAIARVWRRGVTLETDVKGLV